MPWMLVRYRAKPEKIEENQRLIEGVFRELQAKSPTDVRYLVLKLSVREANAFPDKHEERPTSRHNQGEDRRDRLPNFRYRFHIAEIHVDLVAYAMSGELAYR